MKTLETLNFHNTYGRLNEQFYSEVSPSPVPNPHLVALDPDAAALIDLDPAEAKRPEFAEFFAGNRRLPGAQPLSAIYSGHQFGVYVPQLGDGRAILLGEVRNSRGEKWDLQLKGAGMTPYSRMGDGRAVLRSTIREYLCSEAMHGLGIPTTRALCIVGTEMPVYREVPETGAILTRMAPSHVRFGTFEIFYHAQLHDRIRELADYVIGQNYTHLSDAPNKHAAWYREVVVRTARLIAQRQAVGFAHGVMNSDNMSILGLTIDYGPFGFLDDFDQGFICNHSDHGGRYAFDQQPAIAKWNLGVLAQALTPLISRDDLLDALQAYDGVFIERFEEFMRAKLGLRDARDGDREFLRSVFALLQSNRADYTNFFRALGNFDGAEGAENTRLREMHRDPEAFDAWADTYRERMAAEQSNDAERKRRMDAVNPKFVLRNYLAQNAITFAEKGDFTEIEKMRLLLRDPFVEQFENESYAGPAPDWGKRLVVSCSS